MTKDEALRLALEALTDALNKPMWNRVQMKAAITAIKAALEAKDEPDKYAMDIECTKCGAKQSGVLTVHTTPPQQTPITDEDIRKANHHMVCGAYDYSFKQGVRWAEKVHGIKWEWEK